MQLRAAIAGLGTAVPAHRIAQQDAAEQIAGYCGLSADQQRRVMQVHEQTGVATRHSVVLRSSTNGQPAEQSFYRGDGTNGQPSQIPTTSQRMQSYEEHAGPLVREAAERALSQASCAAAGVTHLVTVSCSGFTAPGVDHLLIEKLGLPRSVQRTHVGFMGCHGALNGLRLAKAFVEADQRANVLVCAVELCTLHLQHGFELQGVISNALFADGAAAVLCRAEADAAKVWKLAATGSHYLADSRDAMSWRIGDHGFQMRLAPSVPRLIREHLRPWLTSWLAESGHTPADIGCWAVHPGGPRILQACRESLALPGDALSASEEVLADYGNMSSPTVLFVLERLMDRAARLPAVALGFGPGLAIEALLLDA